MKSVLLYSHPEEPVTCALLKRKDIVYPISIKKFIDEVVIFDEINVESQKITWRFSNGDLIENDKQHYLINRVLGFSDTLFDDFEESDRSYAQSEFKAYLTFAIEAFPYTSARPTAFGICGNRYSLPRQWEMVKESQLHLTTPLYFLGNLSQFKKPQNLVYSEPYNYYKWRPSISNASFAFVRPKGEPVISLVLGEEVSIYTYHTQVILSKDQLDKIKNILQQLRILFSLEIFEALIFVDNDQFHFGMVSNIPLYTCKKPQFDDKIHLYFNTLTS
jgi:hypothetical protein